MKMNWSQFHAITKRESPLTAEKMVLAVLAEATEPLYVGTIYDRVRARFGADAGSDGRINKGLAYATYGGSVRVNGFRRDKTYELVKRKTSEKTAPR